MDDRTFDRLTRAFAASRNRRSLLKGLLGLGGAAAIGAAGSQQPAVSGQVKPPVVITPIPICPPSRQCGQDCCGLSETCCGNVCCTGAEKCCGKNTPAAICVPDDACCKNSDCKHLTDLENCTRGICNQQTHACEAVDRCTGTGLTCCPGDGRSGFCYDPATECCPRCTGPCEICESGQCLGCIAPETCCVLGDLETCLDLTIEGACCTAADCGLEDPELCLVSLCRDFVCEQDSTCLDTEQCCGDFICVPTGDECPGSCSAEFPCRFGQECCLDGQCHDVCPTSCPSGEPCGVCEQCVNDACVSECVGAETCCVLEPGNEHCVDLTVPGSCCLADECGLEGADNCIVSGCIDFMCQPVSECTEGQQCCGDHTCVGIDEACP